MSGSVSGPGCNSPGRLGHAQLEKPWASARVVRHRSDSGSGSEGTTDTTAHRPSHQVADQSGTAKGGSDRMHYSSLRAQAKDGAGSIGHEPTDLRAGDSSDAFLYDLGSGTVETFQQAFNWINQDQSPGVFVDLSTNVPATLDLGTPLPAMFLANNDFSNIAASFSDSLCGENLDLTVETVNVPVPEPGSLT